MKHITILFVTIVTLLFAPAAFAQSTRPSSAPAELCELVLKDGSRVYGTIEREPNTKMSGTK